MNKWSLTPLLVIPLLAVTILLAAACGTKDDGKDGPSVPPLRAVAVEISVSATKLTQGQTASFSAIVFYDDRSWNPLSVGACTIANPEIVKIDDDNGNLKAMKPGATFLRCESDGVVSDPIELLVVPPSEVILSEPSLPPPQVQADPFRIAAVPSSGQAPLDVVLKTSGAVRDNGDPHGRGEVEYQVDWGDGVGRCYPGHYLNAGVLRIAHTYLLAGTYSIGAAAFKVANYLAQPCGGNFYDPYLVPGSFVPMATTTVTVLPPSQ